MKNYTVNNVSFTIAYAFSIQLPNGLITCSCEYDGENLYFPYILRSRRQEWTEDKCLTLAEAVDSCLRYLGVPGKDRPKIVKDVVEKTLAQRVIHGK